MCAAFVVKYKTVVSWVLHLKFLGNHFKILNNSELELQAKPES